MLTYSTLTEAVEKIRTVQPPIIHVHANEATGRWLMENFGSRLQITNMPANFLGFKIITAEHLAHGFVEVVSADGTSIIFNLNKMEEEPTDGA